jgi:hypothetical protein
LFGADILNFGQTLGIKVNHKIGKHFLIGADLNTTLPGYKHNLSFGGQYQNARLMVGGSLFMKLGEHRNFGITTMNSNNLFANFRLTKKTAISVIQIFPNNPQYRTEYNNWRLLLPNITALSYQLLFKKSSLNLGITCKKAYFNGINPNFENVIIPSIKFNRMLK